MKKSLIAVTFLFTLTVLSTHGFSDNISQNLKKIDTVLKTDGYKGVNQQYGIGRFLYNAMNGKTSLESGLDYVFWTELTEKDKVVDDKWRLSQVIDDYEIYKIVDFSNNQLITLTIAIPASTKIPMEGQLLPDGLYLFVGNVDFISLSGIPMLVQGFQPVTLNFK